MELIRSTDYFAAIPNARGVDSLKPSDMGPVSTQALRQHAVAEFSIVALVITTVILVATVALNWSR